MNLSCSNQDPCPVILDSKCVIYEGENLLYIGVNTNDNLRFALEQINTTIGNLVLNGGITQLIGDVSAYGPGIATATLATVNNTPGQFGSSTAIPKLTVDGKGRITAITTDPVFIPSGALDFFGDVSGSGTTGTPVQLTLATVNSNVYGSNSFLKFAVNGKGLVTSATGVGSSDIISALGYTPYNATNPNNYISRTALSAVSPLGYDSNSGQFSIQQAGPAQSGYLSSTDWNTFNNKQAAGNYVTSVSATTPLFSSGGTTPNLTIQQASGSQDGYLSSTDWNTFNNKQIAGLYITNLTGEASGGGPGVANVTLSDAAVVAKVLTGLNITGGSVVDTDSLLIAIGKIQNQLNALYGGSQYQGVWNASTNTPTLTSGVGTKGHYYIVNVPGSTNLDGITDWNLGDWAIFDGTAWQQVDNTDAVVSVNGQTGAVSLTTDNIPEGLTNQYFLTSRARLAISGGTGISYDNITGVITNTLNLSGYVPTSRTLTINGTTYDLSADRSWTVNISGGLPIGGTAGQILAKIDGTDYNAEWIDNYSTQVKNIVKLGAALGKGTPVYVTSADGTNMIVGAAGNQSEATSSKTFGLLETGGALNDQVKVVTYGLLAGLDTSAAGSAGDPVWLGPNGTLLYGLINKPYAPAHMVYIGVVTRKQSNNGEIFVNVQNGFEMDELHNVSAQNPDNNAILAYSTATSLWEKNTIAGVLGYTPANAATYVPYTGATSSVDLGNNVLSVGYTLNVNGSSSLNEGGYLGFKQYTSTAGGTLGYTSIAVSGKTTMSFMFSDSLYNAKQFKFDVSGLTLNAWRTYTMPNASGTLALTSDIPSTANFVTLNTLQTITGVKFFDAEASFDSNIVLTGGDFSIASNGFSSNINTELLSASRNINFPNKSGVVALTSDVPSLSGTTNYISKFTSSSNIGDSSIYDSGTAVTIGNTNGVRAFTVYSATADNHIAVVGSAPSVSMSDLVAGAAYQAKFGLATSNGQYAPGAIAGDFVIISQTAGILFNTNSNTLALKLAGSGAATFASSVTATSLIRSGGTASQILAADGSVITAGTGISISGGTISSTASGGVTSFNTRTGAITLVTGDVTSALGYTPYNATNPSGYITSAALTQLVSPNGGSVVAADSAMPNAANSFIHTLGLGPANNDGHILGMTWTSTSSYGAQIWMDTDPTNRMAIRSRNVSGTWNGWWEVLTEGNRSSYIDTLYYGGSTRLYTGSDGTRNTGWAYHMDNGTGIHWPNNGWHLYPKNASDFYVRSGASDASIQFMRSGTAANYIHNASDNAIGFLSTGRAWILRVDNSGNTTASGDVTAYSDRRIKKDIAPIQDALSKVLLLNGVTYKRTDNEDDSTKIGFIAQDVEKVVSEVVNYDAKNDRYSVSYGNISALIVEAMKEQQVKIDKQDKVIEELKSIINGFTK